MLPLAVDVSGWKVLLVGDGRAALARLDMLEAAGTRDLTVFTPDASPAMVARIADRRRLLRRLPTEAEIAAARLLFLAGLAPEESERLAGIGRAHRVLVNAEDVPPLCDAYALAMVRRGNLVIGISTEGRSPAVARVLRQWLQAQFGAEWEERLEEAVALRERLRLAGAGAGAITNATAALLEPWLPDPYPSREG